MEIGPIWRALLRNKAGYVLIALQIAVTMAIIVNAIAIIQERTRLMQRPSGVDEDNIFYLASMSFAAEADVPGMIDRDLERLRAMPGVRDAISTNSVPLRNGGWSMGLALEPGAGQDASGVAIYFTDEHGIDTFGLNLVAGRNFRPEEVAWNDPNSSRWPATGIITRAMADTLFPDAAGDVVGKTVYVNDDDPVQIIGVVERMQAPWNGWDNVENSMLVPQKRDFSYNRYVIRAEPGQRDALMPQVEQMLADSNRERIVKDMRTMSETRKRSYLGDSALVKLLTFIVTLLTVITGLGIVGLASFSVSRRTRQIGTRRALGASRFDILRYFMLENFIISTLGVAAGSILAVLLNMWMVETFELTRITWYLIPAAMLLLWLVGQFAVAGPARRASMVPPAVATRAV
ncbi:MAG TPA: FtsX-like permease family protein [Woeseiaceae bacterium]|nr:FtsX-like permease family protein [Woeseiaceae bacterium]